MRKSWHKVFTSAKMVLKELLRNRLSWLLIMTTPITCYYVVKISTTQDPIGFRLFNLGNPAALTVTQREISYVFLGLFASSFLSAFIGYNVMRRGISVDKRLIACGYRSWQVIVAKITVLLLIVLLLSAYVNGALYLFCRPQSMFWSFLGFWAMSAVYACLGLLIGAVIRHELTACLLIVFLTVLDAGWLENPTYSKLSDELFVKLLPGYFASQLTMDASFHQGDYMIWEYLLASAYGILAALLALLVFWCEMKTFKIIYHQSVRC